MRGSIAIDAFAVLALQCLQLRSISAQYVCQPTDCDRYDSPASEDRICRLHAIIGGEAVQLGWRAGALEDQTQRCPNPYPIVIADFCPGYVGMRMSLLCDFEEEVAIYKDGVALTGGTHVTYSSLQREHQGLYQCVQLINGSNEVVGEFNMTVQSRVHIGVEECKVSFCDSFRDQKCCRHSWFPHSPRFAYSFNIYGDTLAREPTVDVEWVTGPDTHYPTDLGLRLEQPDVNLTRWNLYIGNFPQTVTEERFLQVVVRVSASNVFSSFSMCLNVRFSISNILLTEKTLPQDANVTEGGSAVFMCTFGTRRPDSPNQPALVFEYFYDSSHSTMAVCLNWTNCSSWSQIPHPYSISLSHTAVSNLNIFTTYNYEVRLTNVATAQNGSTFSCSIVSPYDPLTSEGLIQWKRSSELVVTAAAEESEPPPVSTTVGEVPMQGDERSGSGNLVVVLVPVSVVSLLLLLLVLSSFLVAVLTWSYKKHQSSLNTKRKSLQEFNEDLL